MSCNNRKCSQVGKDSNDGHHLDEAFLGQSFSAKTLFSACFVGKGLIATYVTLEKKKSMMPLRLQIMLT